MFAHLIILLISLEMPDWSDFNLKIERQQKTETS